jgi:hypothetical protein
MRPLLLLLLLAPPAWAVPITDPDPIGRSGITARDGVTPRTGITPRSTHCAHFDPGVCSQAGILPLPAAVTPGAPVGLSGPSSGPIAPTPEPTTLVLLGSAAVAGGWWYRRRR